MQSTGIAPKIGFVLGDQAGIGPEIILKLLHRPHFYDRCSPLLIGNYNLLTKVSRAMYPACRFVSFSANEIHQNWDEHLHEGIPVVDIPGDTAQVITGMVTGASGWITYKSIETAYDLLRTKMIDGLILGPCTKEAISKSGCGFHSEYEILEHCAETDEVQTVVKGGSIQRISVVGHVPFRNIHHELSRERIVKVARRLADVISGIVKETPRLLVASLNSMEDNCFGDEERDIICPAIAELNAAGIYTEGPFPADSLLRRAEETGFNGIVYMYHDQGNIAMKAQRFQTTTCIYTNLDYPVLSTGHGSALDIAELGIANPTNISYVLSVMTEIFDREDKGKLTASAI